MLKTWPDWKNLVRVMNKAIAHQHRKPNYWIDRIEE